MPRLVSLHIHIYLIIFKTTPPQQLILQTDLQLPTLNGYFVGKSIDRFFALLVTYCSINTCQIIWQLNPPLDAFRRLKTANFSRNGYQNFSFQVWYLIQSSFLGMNHRIFIHGVWFTGLMGNTTLFDVGYWYLHYCSGQFYLELHKVLLRLISQVLSVRAKFHAFFFMYMLDNFATIQLLCMY